MAQRGSKDKGLHKAASAHSGMGRLRRAHAKSQVRLGNLGRLSEDDDSLAGHGGTQKTSHTALSLLAKFNRLAQAMPEEQGIPGEVCGFHGTVIRVRDASDHEHDCQIRRRLKKMLYGEKSPLAVGDRVLLSITDEEDWIIEAVLPRRNQIERRDSHNASLSHVFAANIDAVLIVAALSDPPVKPGLIDRYLLLAALSDIPPLIVFNKIDLAAPGQVDQLRKLYQGLGYPCFVTDAQQGSGDIASLRESLRGGSCVIAGQSGVGKSSLINSLYPHFHLRVGAVSESLHKGRHTTTAARSYLLGDGSRLIDTPGIRELGVQVDSPLDVALHYPDLAPLHAQCRYSNCTHTHEPDCAVKRALAQGAIAVSRYNSYLSILAEDLGMDIKGPSGDEPCSS